MRDTPKLPVINHIRDLCEEIASEVVCNTFALVYKICLIQHVGIFCQSNDLETKSIEHVLFSTLISVMQQGANTYAQALELSLFAILI